jgi:hypothetical protein
MKPGLSAARITCSPEQALRKWPYGVRASGDGLAAWQACLSAISETDRYGELDSSRKWAAVSPDAR